MMAKIKTADLTGPALDWAVAKREGHHVGVISKDEQWQRFISNGIGAELAPTELITFRASLRPKLCVIEIDGYKNIFAASKLNYSTDWAQGGPIIEREGIIVGKRYAPKFLPKHSPPVVDWTAQYFEAPHSALEVHRQFGPTPLIAAMRCYVASKLGDEVDVPDELTGD